MSDTPVWFITGCSTGFGRALAERVLARGWRVVATARDRARVADLSGDGDALLALDLDVTDAGQIAAAVDAAKTRFGRIDVLVNNAGYGYQAAIEEGVEEEIRAQFDANVFGLFALTRAVLPLMRHAGRGHILNITSVAGLAGFPASGYYAASKHAVEGWSDSLAAEVAPLGLHVTCVEPGPFRTDWAGRSLRQTPNRIAAYAETAGARMKSTSDISGQQAGDPVRAADAMIALTERADPPRHLVLGRWGHDAVVQRLRERLAEIESLRDEALATDFPDGG
ncbi:oxidoreductase [Sphingomonas carotinifaciens]|uniref:SDR family NAD(P)-dependent oxidoreductase n=1 Tax=Sphingomonas carotinifaciens TaxID=1166323 RepID=A0A1G7KSB3_9SPHN|nr:oxidoreductase [Sphingomonas carotinifaciens]MBB4085381.1 NAD(P)-dependent dehydrogenase (short-subunit alcohol dehydrogenase family) [Sphingomonas carotinifaciens]MWC43593.1 SDR family NAD(P)-dependent oxidoreductase [Sphingomonas carotinifaciens]SDF39986.1 Short-chain dehydrogenase [Sphingomonas carotinifaciens]